MNERMIPLIPFPLSRGSASLTHEQSLCLTTWGIRTFGPLSSTECGTRDVFSIPRLDLGVLCRSASLAAPLLFCEKANASSLECDAHAYSQRPLGQQVHIQQQRCLLTHG